MARFTISENFALPPNGTTGNPFYLFSGFSGTSALCDAKGSKLITHGHSGFSGFSGAFAKVAPVANTTLSTPGFLQTDAGLSATMILHTGADVTNCVIHAGLMQTNTGVIGTDDDCVFLRYEHGNYDNKWHVVVSRAGVDEVYPTSVSCNASSPYIFNIEIDPRPEARSVSIRINGSPVRFDPLAPMTDAVSLYPYAGVISWDTLVKNIVMSRIEVGRNI